MPLARCAASVQATFTGSLRRRAAGPDDTCSMWFLVTLLVTWAVAAGVLGVAIGRTTRLRDASF